jgi:hypothetical protein
MAKLYSDDIEVLEMRDREREAFKVSPALPISTCCTCGYSWNTGKNGSHSCSTLLDLKVQRLTWLLGQIIQDLPDKRDWLNPDIEKEARTYLPTNLKA